MLPQAEPRLQRRYERLVMAHVSVVEAVAAGVRALPDLAAPLAVTQAAWRFYANKSLRLPQLAGPLIDCAKAQIATACGAYTLLAMDWSGLHLTGHKRRADRVDLSHHKDLGYELLTALALSDRDGRPLAPVALELEAAAGVYSTTTAQVRPGLSHLDRLGPLMGHIARLDLGKEPVFILDREADSVGHFRQFIAARRLFLIRANRAPHVAWNGATLTLSQVAKRLQALRPLEESREVEFQGHRATQYVGHTHVTLTRPARSHRYVGTGKNRRRRHTNQRGPAIVLRLIVSEVRNQAGKVLARWLLLSNLPEAVSAATLALWYYWRWRIESYHKLIKGAGLHLEHWQQETAAAFSRRLLVAAMAVTLVWQLAASKAPAAADLRAVLVRLSGRQIKRGKTRPTFTIPALLAGLGVLMPMLCLLEDHPLEELRALVRQTMPFSRFTRTLPAESG